MACWLYASNADVDDYKNQRDEEYSVEGSYQNYS